MPYIKGLTVICDVLLTIRTRSRIAVPLCVWLMTLLSARMDHLVGLLATLHHTGLLALTTCHRTLEHTAGEIDGLVPERHNSSVLAMELCLSCTKPSRWCFWCLCNSPNHIVIQIIITNITHLGLVLHVWKQLSFPCNACMSQISVCHKSLYFLYNSRRRPKTASGQDEFN